MKYFIFSLVTLFTGVANAQTAQNPWDWTVYARYRFEDASQYDLVNTKQFSSIRIRPTINYTGIDRLKVVIEPQFNKVMGGEAFTPSSTTANSTTETSGNTAYNGSLDSMTFRSAYLDVSMNENFNLLVGRQALSYGDQYIIGPADWGIYGRTFDAARLKFKNDSFQVDGFQAKIVETVSTANNNGGDKDLYGLYGTYSRSGFIKTADLYGFYLQDNQSRTAVPADDTRPWHFGTYGGRLVSEEGPWSWKAEIAKNFGTENTAAMGRDDQNAMVDARVNYQFSGSRPQKLGLQIYQAGENWRELYPTPYEPFGRTDLLGRRNIMGAALHLSSVWSEKWQTEVSGYYFQRTNTDTMAFQPDGKTAVGNLNSNSSYVGTEIDLVAKYAMTQNLTLSGSYNYFFVGDYLKESVGGENKSPSYLYLMLEAKY